MKKFAAIAAVCAVGLGSPLAFAGGGKKDFEGSIDPGGTLSFTVKKTNDGKKVVKYTFSGMPADCASGAQTVSGRVTFGVNVKKNKFKTKAVSGNPNNPNGVLELKGEINGDKADGTLHVYGKAVEIDPPGSDVREACDTGKQNWIADKV